MLRAIRLKLFQQMPNYRKPSSFTVKESFPLPPYSTVIGMVHSACDFKEYHPMRISIQGNHASDIADIETQYVFGENWGKSDKESSHQHRIISKENPTGYKVIDSPKSIQFLTDVELCIHIVPENPEDLETIYNGLLNPKEYISLGRREDIARIDEVKKVDLEEIIINDEDDFDEYVITKYSAYCPFSYMEDISHGDINGTVYKIPKVFDTTSKLRKWKKVIPVRYLPKDIEVPTKLLNNENVFLDNDICVFLA